MKTYFKTDRLFACLRNLLILVGLFLGLSSSGAALFKEDFEDDPAHALSWVNTQNAASMAGWSVLCNGYPAALTSTWASAQVGESFSGSQALVLAASGSSQVLVRRASPLPLEGTGFAGVALRLPQLPLANALPDLSAPALTAAVSLEGLWLTFAPVSSGLARWHYWHSAALPAGSWQGVGPLMAVGGADGLAKDWSRLHLRRDRGSRAEGDLWINGKPVAVQIPLDLAASGFQLRASSLGASYVDALGFSDSQPLFSDGDRDGMPDSWEFSYASLPNSYSGALLQPAVDDREADPDRDGVSNIREYLAGSNPLLVDSDGDGMPDAWEIQYALNPADARDADGDYDFDGVLNAEEYAWQTSPQSSNGNGPKVKYVRSLNGSLASDSSQPSGSLANPYSYFPTALQSVPDGGKLVVLGAGGPLDLSGPGVWEASSRNITITGVDNAVLTGTSGSGALLTFQGGGRSVSLDNLTFSRCRAGASGGALAFYECPVKLTRCRFEYCAAADGGALALIGTSAEIADGTFYKNSATASGGAIWASGTRLSLQRTRFVAQTATARGAALLFASCTGEIASCLFAGNQCSGGGGTLAVEGSAAPLLNYATVADNLVASGAAVESTAAVPLQVVGCILWGNKVASNGAIVNIAGAANLTATTTQGTLFPGVGNNTSNPMFLRSYHPLMASVPGDGYGLAAGSGMIDRGSSSLAPALDIDGLPRRRSLAASSTAWTSNADRGAFEYNDSDADNIPDGWEGLYALDASNPEDRDLDADQDGFSNYEEYAAKTHPRSAASRPGPVLYVSPAGSDTADGSLANPLKTIARALALAPPSGGRIALWDGLYAGPGNVNLSSAAKAAALVGINGSARVIVDCANASRFLSNGSAPFSLAGITIRNALATSGDGGAICWTSFSAPLTLYRCRFVNCRAPAGFGGALCLPNGSAAKCEFLGNSASEGGAVAARSASGPSLFLHDNTFAWNDASLQGGALSWTSVPGGEILRNSFYRNTARSGGAIALKDCLARDPAATLGGALSASTLPMKGYYYNIDVSDNTFTENSAWPNASSPSGGVTAGALSLSNATIWLSGGSFERNLSLGQGGALLQTTGATQVYRVRFLENEAASDAGASAISAGTPSFINCAFIRNRSGGQGGALRTAVGAKLALRHVTLVANDAANSGAACWSDGSLLVHNSLIWFHGTESSCLAGSGVRNVFGSNGEAGCAPLGGTSGNSSVAPLLAWDRIHLAGSPGSLNSAQLSLASQAAESGSVRDLDAESRPLTSANLPETGCDEFLDSDGDGLPDWYEKQILALSPGVADILPETKLWNTPFSASEYLLAGANPLRLDADSDGDGLSDLRELSLKLNPQAADSNGDGTVDIDPAQLLDLTKDSDLDGVLNGDDAFPAQKYLSFPRSPESRYAFIDLGPGAAVAVNASGQVLIGSHDPASDTTRAYRWPAAVPGTPLNRDEVGESRLWPTSEQSPYQAGMLEPLGIDDAGNIYFRRALPEVAGQSIRRDHEIAQWNEQGLVHYAEPKLSFAHPTLGAYKNQGVAGARIDGAGFIYAGTSSAAIRGSKFGGYFNEIGRNSYNCPLYLPGTTTALAGAWTTETHEGNSIAQTGPGVTTADFQSTDFKAALPAGAYASDWYAVSRGGRAFATRSSAQGVATAWWQFSPTSPAAAPAVFPVGWPVPLAQNDMPRQPRSAPGYTQGALSVATAAGQTPSLYVHTAPGTWVRLTADLGLPDAFKFPADETLPYGTLAAKDAPPEFTRPVLYPKQVRINNRAEIVWGTQLWRNGQTQKIKNLISLPEAYASSDFHAADINDSGLIAGSCQSQTGEWHAVALVPIEVVELAPKTTDEDGNEIKGSEKPSSGKQLTPFVEIDPHANRIAHRELKVLIGKSMKDKKVTWTLNALPGAIPSVIRGAWSNSPVTAHTNCFEQSVTYGESGFRVLSGTGKDAKAETTVGADGHTAIRVNVPPIGFNQARITIKFGGMSTPMDLIDMEVPAVVVIDPGHGGQDSGAVGAGGVQEKDLALDYGLSLRRKLNGRFAEEKHILKVVMTRQTTEAFPSLASRPQRARDTGADVFVSIHFNSGAETARGTETFVERTAAEASNGNPGDNKNVEEDEKLASVLNTITLNAVAASDSGAINRFVKREGKAVTRDGASYNGNTQDYHPVRACLIEVEFLSNTTALETIKLSTVSGVAIKEAFAENGAIEIFNNIRD